MGNDSDVSPDRRFVAYRRHAAGNVRRRRNGKAIAVAARRASRSWISRSRVRKVPQPAGRSNDLNPMWIGGTLYFNSDRNGEFNLYSFEPAIRRGHAAHVLPRLSGRERQRPATARSSSSRRVACTCSIHPTAPTRRCTSQTQFGPARDASAAREQRRLRPQRFAARPTSKPSRSSIAARSSRVPAKKGVFRNLTQSPGANDRAPAWSPSGAKIAWFSDRSGEYALYVRDRDGSTRRAGSRSSRARASIAT